MTTNYLPYSIGFVCGFAAAVIALLTEWILRTREPHDLPHRSDGGEQPATPPPPADDRLDFAAITDALRKKE
jgi:hypothetical protein